MYNYYFCSKINDEFYDHKLDLNKLSYLINKYDLKCKNKVKEYWINNVYIISDDTLSFYKIIDNNINYDNNYLIHNYDKKSCNPFNFHEANMEDEYILYDNTINNIKIIVKEYDDYITLHYECENIINNNNFLYYINI